MVLTPMRRPRESKRGPPELPALPSFKLPTVHCRGMQDGTWRAEDTSLFNTLHTWVDSSVCLHDVSDDPSCIVRGHQLQGLQPGSCAF